MKFYKKAAFTLIELLTVIAIIGILAAILIPTVGAAKNSANKAKSKVQFSQWAAAMGMFKQEYGYYPTSIAVSNKISSNVFFPALTGKDYLGQVPGNYFGNTKALSYYSAADSEITSTANGDATNGQLKDAFGNTDIAIFFDTNGDGVINGSDTPALSTKQVVSVNTTLPLTPTFSTGPGVRAGVIIYSAGKGTTANDIVYSWQ